MWGKTTRYHQEIGRRPKDGFCPTSVCAACQNWSMMRRAITASMLALVCGAPRPPGHRVHAASPTIWTRLEEVPATPPGQPEVTETHATWLVVNWTAPAIARNGGNLSYRLWMQEGGTAFDRDVARADTGLAQPFELLGDELLSNPGMVVHGLKASTWYRFYAQGVDGSGAGPKSEESAPIRTLSPIRIHVTLPLALQAKVGPLDLDVESQDSVLILKQKIKEATGTPVADQQLAVVKAPFGRTSASLAAQAKVARRRWASQRGQAQIRTLDQGQQPMLAPTNLQTGQARNADFFASSPGELCPTDATSLASLEECEMVAAALRLQERTARTQYTGFPRGCTASTSGDKLIWAARGGTSLSAKYTSLCMRVPLWPRGPALRDHQTLEASGVMQDATLAMLPFAAGETVDARARAAGDNATVPGDAAMSLNAAASGNVSNNKFGYPNDPGPATVGHKVAPGYGLPPGDPATAHLPSVMETPCNRDGGGVVSSGCRSHTRKRWCMSCGRLVWC